MVGKDLISKITAGGLSAGIFLLWWPLHLPTEGLVWLILRGVFWTLTCEALLLAFVPLERMLGRGLRTGRFVALRRRLHSAPVRVRAAGALVLALAGFGIPVSLLSTGAAEQLPTTATRVVVKEVVVERPVIEKRVVVRQVVPAMSSAGHPAGVSAVSTGRVHPGVSAPRRPRPAVNRKRPTRTAPRDADRREPSAPADPTAGARDDASAEAAPEVTAPAGAGEPVAPPSGSTSSADRTSPPARAGAASRPAPGGLVAAA